jgi:VWFA-related protein
MSTRVVVVSAVVALCAALPDAWQKPVAPQTPPVFKSGSELVEVDAFVTDKSGAIMRGLTRDDFEVIEDGKPQAVVQFSFVDIPAPQPDPAPNKSAPPPAPPDVATNTHPLDSRLYVIVLDGFHVDPTRSALVRKQARQFVQDDVGASDQVAVVTLGNGTANQPFTSSKPLVFASIDHFIGQKSRSATLNTEADSRTRTGGNQDMQSAAEDAEAGAKANEAMIALGSISQLCQRLGTSQGHRRSIVMFSEGLEIDTSDFIGEDKRPGAGGQGLKYESAKYAAEVIEAQRAMFEAAQRANVAIYTVDPRGSSTGEDLLMQAQGMPLPPRAGAPPVSPTLSIMEEVKRSQGTLRTFSDVTGGVAVVNTTNFTGGFTRIVQANSSYYVLSYTPANLAHDGTFRSISVSVKRPGVEVTARKGYYATDDAKPAAALAPTPAKTSDANAPSGRMRDLLASQLPVSGLGLRVSGGPLRTQGDKTLVGLIVEIDTATLPFTEESGLLANDIEVAFQALDPTGKTLVANRQLGKLRLPSAERSAMTHGLRYVVEFLLPPGRAQVRVGAHESAGDGAGSAILDVETVDLTKAPLSVGTIMLTSDAAQAMPTTGAYPLLKSVLPTPPTTVREFARDSPIVAFANISDSDTQNHTVDITTRVTSADGHDVFRHSVSKPNTDLAASKNGFGYVSDIPLNTIAPGRYTLTIEAKGTNGKTASRALAFAVR